MRLNKALLVCLLLFLAVYQSSSLFAQHTNFNTQRNWSLNKKEIIFGLGVTQFTGDLGGRDQIGKDFSLVDIDLPSTGFGGMIGYRYRFHPYWATTTSLNIGRLRGDDALTNEIIRESRNLHFRSIILELHQRLEFIFYSNEKFGARYRLPGHKGAKNHNEQVYVFGGIGGSYFNPKARYNGRWVALDPLNTEGQGMAGGARETLPVTLTIPMGLGVRFGIGRQWRFALEATYVKTFSDYIDDVHGFYYDPNSLQSPEASYLSNPAKDNVTWFAPGQMRGQPQKDAYYYLNVVVMRNVTYRDYTLKRRQYYWKRARYKF
ncbi:MAG: hypothetical protein RIT43_2436 [Bacteroidota bacterium]|jgi:hypothetical protein